MKTSYLIDGYNVGFKIPQVAKLIKSGKTDLAVDAIISRIQSLLIKKSARALIVFDGIAQAPGLPRSHGNIRVEFSRKPRTADDEIRDFISRKNHLENWVVVSSDNEIRYTAQDHGARALRSEEFVKLLSSVNQSQASSENHQKYDPKNIDLDYWMEQFRSDNDNEK
jgi:predicted RNA-binding protein with PIN domain